MKKDVRLGDIVKVTGFSGPYLPVGKVTEICEWDSRLITVTTSGGIRIELLNVNQVQVIKEEAND